MRDKLTKIAKDLPATVPFVGPETQERENNYKFLARIGANESVFGPSKKVQDAIKIAVTSTWQYGDPENFDLIDALASFYSLKRENFVVGEGIDGLLGYLVRLFVEPGEQVVTSLGAYPTFNYHVVGFGGKLSLVPYKNFHEDLYGLIKEAKKVKAKILYLSNPDNPMGTFHQKRDVQKFIDEVPDDTLLCLDEAYSDFVDQDQLPELDTSRSNVIRFRTFSKAYGLAGLRVGYAIGNSTLISSFNKVRNHFGVNKIGQIAALAALEDQEYLQKTLIAVEESKIRIKSIFSKMGFSSLESHTNFVAINMGKDSNYAKNILTELIKNKIFVRMPGVTPLNSFIRVSAGQEEDLRYLEKAMAEIMRKN